jgi:putative colanic acid biosynthesis glycosyltransferase
MKLLQINSVINSGSTGRIAEDIGMVMMRQGHESAIVFGRGNRPSRSKKIRVGNKLTTYTHVLQTRLLDKHGFASGRATKKLINKIEEFRPDIIGLHNLHGYYLHAGELFQYLKKKKTPVVWTLHDCWPFTGHCAHFMRVGCEKWKTHCRDCPLTSYYPKSWIRDRSYQNFDDKREAFTGHPNLTIVTPSRWLKMLVGHSFLNEYPVEVIHNGINLETFRPVHNQLDKPLVLGVASTWTDQKGLNDFVRLREKLSKDIDIVLIGLSALQIGHLPDGIKGIARTESVEKLAEWYSRAVVYVNPTYVDNFPTTNIEALACGTPVITYDTGGSSESVDEKTGLIVERGDSEALEKAIRQVLNNGKESYRDHCRSRAQEKFNKKERFLDYLKLYTEMVDL